MGKVKIRYYVTRQRPGRPKWGYWAPTPEMKKAGFHLVDCGEDGPSAWTVAESWNARWDEARRLAKPAAVGHDDRPYPRGSLGEAFARFRATRTWMEKKPRTREDWERGFRLIGPVFGDVDPRTVSLEEIDRWYAALLKAVGVREAHRAMKIWRALWRVAGSLGIDGRRYCDRNADPSLGVRRKTPKPRNAIWYEGEVARLVKRAWREGYRGLAAALAVAWDTMLSPVDVRGLTLAQLSDDGEGSVFSLARAKTGQSAIGTLSRRTARVVSAYLAGLPFAMHPDKPMFLTRGGKPGPRGGRPRPPAAYTQDTFGDDFRAVRNIEFPGDTRKLMDFRRSGAVEAAAGEVDPMALAKKMANTIDQSRALQDTYLPHNATVVRLADQARQRGRGRLRGKRK